MMAPMIIIDLRDDAFTTKSEMVELLRERMDEAYEEFGDCEIGQVIITPHHEKMLKLELAENFVFRWKNIKNKRLDNIDGTPIIKLEPDEPIRCPNCGGVYEDEEE